MSWGATRHYIITSAAGRAKDWNIHLEAHTEVFIYFRFSGYDKHDEVGRWSKKKIKIKTSHNTNETRQTVKDSFMVMVEAMEALSTSTTCRSCYRLLTMNPPSGGRTFICIRAISDDRLLFPPLAIVARQYFTYLIYFNPPLFRLLIHLIEQPSSSSRRLLKHIARFVEENRPMVWITTSPRTLSVVGTHKTATLTTPQVHWLKISPVDFLVTHLTLLYISPNHLKNPTTNSSQLQQRRTLYNPLTTNPCLERVHYTKLRVCTRRRQMARGQQKRVLAILVMFIPDNPLPSIATAVSPQDYQFVCFFLLFFRVRYDRG